MLVSSGKRQEQPWVAPPRTPDTTCLFELYTIGLCSMPAESKIQRIPGALSHCAERMSFGGSLAPIKDHKEQDFTGFREWKVLHDSPHCYINNSVFDEQLESHWPDHRLKCQNFDEWHSVSHLWLTPLNEDVLNSLTSITFFVSQSSCQGIWSHLWKERAYEDTVLFLP